MQNEQGNITLLVLGVILVGMFMLAGLGLFVQANIQREAVGLAANAAALAATDVLQDVFVEDISEEAYAKLNQLMQAITDDPLSKKGQIQQAILLHTRPSQLRTELLAGKRGRLIQLHVLLAYQPFFTEQLIGQRIQQSFERHLALDILPSVHQLLRQNGNPHLKEIRFPIHNKIEVAAVASWQPQLMKRVLKNRQLQITSRGYALHIPVLDEYQISYKFQRISR